MMKKTLTVQLYSFLLSFEFRILYRTLFYSEFFYEFKLIFVIFTSPTLHELKRFIEIEKKQ